MKVLVWIVIALTCGRQHFADGGITKLGYSAKDESQVGIFYGLGSSFRVSQLLSFVPRRVRMMARCVQRVGSGHDMSEIRDEINYVIELLQKHPASGPVLFELEMIYIDAAQALSAVPSVVMKPPSNLSLDDVMTLRDAAFHIMVLPVRIERLRSSLTTMLFNRELYSLRLASELSQRIATQIQLSARMGSEILRCPGAELPAITEAATPAATTTTTTMDEHSDSTQTTQEIAL